MKPQKRLQTRCWVCTWKLARCTLIRAKVPNQRSYSDTYRSSHSPFNGMWTISSSLNSRFQSGSVPRISTHETSVASSGSAVAYIGRICTLIRAESQSTGCTALHTGRLVPCALTDHRSLMHNPRGELALCCLMVVSSPLSIYACL